MSAGEEGQAIADSLRDEEGHIAGMRLAGAVLLAAIAGWIDAVGYLHFAHLFVSFMSGNSTVLAVALSDLDWLAALAPFAAILCFVFGSFAGTLMTAASGEWRLALVLVVEALLLVGALALGAAQDGFPFGMIPLAVAMGLQNAAMQRVGSVSVSLTYVTGALVKLGQSLADLVLGRQGHGAWSVHALMWLGLTAGATGGAAAYLAFGYDSLLGPIAVLAVFGPGAGLVVAARRFLAWWRRRNRPSPAAGRAAS